MSNPVILPQQRVAPLDRAGIFGRNWYLFFQSIGDQITQFIQNLVNPLADTGRILKVESPGVIGESSITDDGSTVSTLEHVGIGNSTPHNLLDVGDAALGTFSFAKSAVISSSGTNSQLMLGQSTTDFAHVRWHRNATPANAYMAIGSDNGQALALQDISGDVGIGTVTPAYKLQVVGDISGSAYWVGSTPGESTTITYVSGVDFVMQTVSTKTVSFTTGIETAHT
jgi:hypothetical protein